MTADFEILPDLEDFDNLCKGFIEGYINDCNLPFSPVKKPPSSFEPYIFGGAFYDTKLESLECDMEFESPPLFEESLGFPGHDFANAFIHSENDPEFLNLNLVDPVSCLPLTRAVPCLPLTRTVSCLPLTPDKEEDEDDYDDEKYDDFDESLESVLPDDIMDLTDEKLIKLVDNNFINCSNYVSLDDVLVKKPRKFTHLDIDHSYSIRPEGYYEEVNEYYNSPLSPSSSECSDTTPKGTKRGRPPKKNTACKKIKQEICSEDEEVDVESPYTVSLVVPKITLELSPPPSPPTPPKRGRKPKNKSQVPQKNKKSPKIKNCPVPPKVLEEAIKKQQTKKNYVTKSGRITKVRDSVESSPSTSNQSSQNSSRCSSDNEDTADKRASHNQAERQRRQQLTDLFQILRKRVPAVMSVSKASKVAILTEASKHIEDLEEIQRTRKLCKDQEKTELAKKLSLLQSLIR